MNDDVNAENLLRIFFLNNTIIMIIRHFEPDTLNHKTKKISNYLLVMQDLIL